MDLPQAGHHGKEVGNVYSIKKCDKKTHDIFSGSDLQIILKIHLFPFLFAEMILQQEL